MLLNSPRQNWNIVVIETRYRHELHLLCEATGLPEETTVKEALEAMDILSMQGKKAEILAKIFKFFKEQIDAFKEFFIEFAKVAADKAENAGDGFWSKLWGKTKDAAKERSESVNQQVEQVVKLIDDLVLKFSNDGIIGIISSKEEGRNPALQLIFSIVQFFKKNYDLAIDVLKRMPGNQKVQAAMKYFFDTLISLVEPLIPGLQFAIATAGMVLKVVGTAKEVIRSIEKGPDDFFGEILDKVGQAPDKDTRISPFLDLFNMDDEFQVMLDDQLESKFLAVYRKQLQDKVKQDPDMPIMAFDINEALKKYLIDEYSGHTVMIQEK